MIEDIYPLSPMQQGILFHCLYEQSPQLYLTQAVWTFGRDFDPVAFERAWQSIMDRHSIFRSAFVWQGLDEPVQAVHQHRQAAMQQMDWREASRDEAEQRLQEFLEADRAAGFVFTSAPLMRFALIRAGSDRWLFVWTRHHLVLDGWSEVLLVQELSILYPAFRQGLSAQLPARPPFGDYIDWLRRQDQSQAERFWKRLLGGYCGCPPLKGHSPAASEPSRQTHSGTAHLQLEAQASEALLRLARQGRLTLNSLIQGAWGLLLAGWLRRRDVVFGATVSGRPAALPGVESMMGLFLNTLPVRIGIRSGIGLTEWLQEIQGRFAESLQYEYASLVQIQACSAVPKGTPLFESLLVFQNAPAGAAEDGSALGVLEASSIDGATNFALSLDVRPGPPLEVIFTYDRHRFEPDSIDLMAEQLTALLQAFPQRPQASPKDFLELLGEVERRRRSQMEKQLEAASLLKLSKLGRKAIHGHPMKGTP